MKRLALLLIGVFLASLILASVPVEANARFVPHEDPSTAQSSLDSYSFLNQYAQVFGLISAEQYANASKISQELSHISVPADLTYIINRYNNLTQQFISTLSQLKTTLDNASSLLSQNRFDEAGTNLDKAGVLVSQAEILLSELQDATTTLSQQLGVFAASAQSKVTQAYDSLQSILQRLSDLINEYHTLLQQTSNQRETRAKQLVPTALTLNLNTASAFVGGTIATSGVLTSDGQVLPHRGVSLLLSGSQVATATTDSSGHFSAVLTVPYTYVPVMTVQALYAPTGNDANIYFAALSPALQINVIFYSTELQVSAPPVAYPGLPLTVSGSIILQGGGSLSNRTARLLLDDILLGETQSDSNGSFSLQTVMSPQTSIGSHTLTVSVDPEGISAGVSQQKTLTVDKMISTANIQAPSFVLLPSEIQIKGTVSSASGPLNSAIVTVNFDSSSAVTETLNNGSFNVRVNAPLNVGLGGFQSLKVAVQPQQPWQAAGTQQSSIFAFNSVGLGIALVSAISVGAVTFSKFAKPKARKEKKTAPTSAPTTASAEIVVPQVSSQPEIAVGGVKGKVLEEYINALKSVESATGNSLRLEMTLREFFHGSEGKLGELAPRFGELTRFAEKALYSPHIPEEHDLLRAKELSSEISGRLTK